MIRLIHLVAGLLLATASWSEPLMSKAQYEQYSVLYRCAQIQHHDDLDKQESELIAIEKKFGLNDDNFDAFDELITEYERDEALLERIRVRVKKECI